MSLPLKWEFPGGKIEKDELEESCLIREIKEELNLSIIIRKRLKSCVHKYPSFSIELIPFICEIAEGNLVLKEHSSVRWCNPNELDQFDWAEADLPVLKQYLNQ